MFTNDAKSGAFTAQIRQPIASAGSRTIARDDRPTGQYVLNVLPFASIPETLSVVRLKVPLWERPDGVSLDDAGTFIHRDREIWSFAPVSHLLGIFNVIVDSTGSRQVRRVDVESDPNERRIQSWLLRKHFERHLGKFAIHGLILEEGRRRRAYFEGREGGKARKYVYDTPRRKSIVREVVKQRADQPKAWFENEGFGYEVTQLDGEWAVRIKPFYMFTGRDARKPLPTFARAARSTRRIKLDRNKNVEDDLTFWARFLGEGGAVMNIGQEHVPDLILEGQFLTVEVPEEGLLKDSDEGQNRMPA